jgi:transcription factor S
MEFCPKCGSILMMKKKRFGCPRCGYTSKDKIKMEIKEKIKETEKIKIADGNQKDVLPRTHFDCEKCKNKEAYFWTSQTADGDESESEFYKCTKCGNVVREKDF